MSSCSNLSDRSSTDSTGKSSSLLSSRENTLFINVGAKHRGQRKYGTSKRPSIMQPATKPAAPPKRELQKSTPKTAKEFIDTRWPKVGNSLPFNSECLLFAHCRICLTTCLVSGACSALRMILKLLQKTTLSTWTRNRGKRS